MGTYELLGYKDTMEIIRQHPNGKLYLRRGYEFRGAREGEVTMEQMDSALKNMCCCDVEVKGDDVHVNTFSVLDME